MHYGYVIATAAVVVVTVTCGCVTDSQGEVARRQESFSLWFNDFADHGNTRSVPLTVPSVLEERWVWTGRGHDMINAGAVTDMKGNAYVATGSDLCCLSADGHLNWQFHTPLFKMEGETVPLPVQSVAVSVDGTVYVGAGPALFALDAGGNLKWTHTEDQYLASCVLSRNGETVYAGFDELVAIGADGEEEWRYSFAERSMCSQPAVSENGNLYCVTSEVAQAGRQVRYDTVVAAISSQGRLMWETHLDGSPRGQHTVLCGGQLYVVTDPSIGSTYSKAYRPRVHALDLAGSKLWEYQVPTAHSGNTRYAAASDGAFFCISGGTQGKNLYAIDRSGTLRWIATLDRPIYYRFAVDGQGTIFVTAGLAAPVMFGEAASSRTVWRIDAEGKGTPLAGVSEDTGGDISIGLGGQLFIPAAEYSLICYDEAK